MSNVFLLSTSFSVLKYVYRMLKKSYTGPRKKIQVWPPMCHEGPIRTEKDNNIFSF